MHDTLEVFAGRLPELKELWLNTMAPRLQRRSASRVSNAAAALFGRLNDDIRRSAEISAERALSPEAIMAACRYGFIHVFG